MRRTTKQNDNKLLAAIKQLSVILKPDGSLLETHVRLQNNWATAFNGILAGGEPIQEDLIAAPNAQLLKEALSKCGQSFSLTQLAERISIKGDKFKALIPCVPVENLELPAPDPVIAELTPNFIKAIEAVSKIPEDENRIVTASILIQNGSVFATDAKIMLEYWHGIDLPKLVLPKAVIEPLNKNNKTISKFGYGKSSCTFYYEDDSWLRTQFFAKDWPDIRSILDRKTNAHIIPSGLFDAAEALEPFSEDGYIYFDSNIIRSHALEVDAGASYEVYGIPRGPILNIKQLKILEPYMKTVDFLVPNGNYTMTIFYGDNCRGAISGRTN